MFEFTDFHKPEKTKVDIELEQFAMTVEQYDEQKVNEELSKINKKLNVTLISARTYQPQVVDISGNAEQKNRLYCRKAVSGIAKWLSYAIKKSNGDYSALWNLINATFVSRTIAPDLENPNLIIDGDFSFIDTLSLNGLQLYKKFLTCVSQFVIFEDASFASAARRAKQMVFGFENKNEHMFDLTILPNNWKTYYKYIMQQKILLDKKQSLQLDVQL